MKPTEADIKGLLIEGWEFGGFSSAQIFDSGPRFPIGPNGWFSILGLGMEIGFFNASSKVVFKFDDKEQCSLSYDAILSGEYSLPSCWNEKYWKPIITMCESIVRLITGEQVEQTLEEKVRELTSWFSPSELTIGKNEVNFKTAIAQYKVTNTLVGERSLGDGASWTYFNVGTYKRAGVGERLWKTLESIAALLTEQPEQTLEEAVRGIFKRWEVREPDEMSCYHNRVKVKYLNTRVTIYHDCASHGGNCFPFDVLIGRCGFSHELIAAFKDIAAELKDRSTSKPTYEFLEQRVEELEKENQTLREFNKENQKLLDYADTHLGEVDRLGQKIVDLEAQLQDYISPADHEAEIKKLNALVCELDKDRLAAVDAASRNLSWFHREYAKNAELESSGLKSVARSLS